MLLLLLRYGGVCLPPPAPSPAPAPLPPQQSQTPETVSMGGYDSGIFSPVSVDSFGWDGRAAPGPDPYASFYGADPRMRDMLA